MTDYFTNHPIVSVIIPYYNNPETISATLENLAQCEESSKFEVFLIEDAKSETLPQSCLQTAYPFRLIYHKSTKSGASANRNLGIKYATANYIQFLDADDLISANKIKCQIDEIEKDGSQNTLMICSWGIFYKDAGDFEMSSSVLYQNWKSENYLAKLNSTFSVLMPIHSYLIPKHLIEKAGHWDERISHGDDGEFMNRIIAVSESVNFVQEGCAMYRRGNAMSLSHRKDDTAIASNWLCLQSFDNLYQKRFECSDLIRKAVIFRYQLFFISNFTFNKALAKKAAQRILALGGKLNPRIGSPISLFFQNILGIKVYLKIKSAIRNSSLIKWRIKKR